MPSSAVGVSVPEQHKGKRAALFTSIAETLDATLARLDGNVLRTTTIDPRTSFGGLVALDLPKSESVTDMVAIVTFAGDTHVIPLNNAAGTLRQATASELAGMSANAPPPSAGRLDAAASISPPPPPPAPARPPTWAMEPQKMTAWH